MRAADARAGARAARRARPKPSARLRPATPEDCEDIWRWRNDEGTRRASLDPSFIDLDAHRRWFLASLASDTRKIYVVVGEGRASGVVRLDLAGRDATVSIFLDPKCQGRGLGPEALRAAGDLARRELGVRRLIAAIKSDNRASLSAFAKAGYVSSRSGARGRGSGERSAPLVVTVVNVLRGSRA